jgi:arginase family enzyme
MGETRNTAEGETRVKAVAGDEPVYLSFAVDGLDPVCAPGTGTPEIGGYSTFEAQQMVRACRGLDLVGATLSFEILCPLAETTAKRRAR